MKRVIIETRNFKKIIDRLLQKREILKQEFDIFKKALAEHPNVGVVITGSGEFVKYD